MEWRGIDDKDLLVKGAVEDNRNALLSATVESWKCVVGAQAELETSTEANVENRRFMMESRDERADRDCFFGYLLCLTVGTNTLNARCISYHSNTVGWLLMNKVIFHFQRISSVETKMHDVHFGFRW